MQNTLLRYKLNNYQQRREFAKKRRRELNLKEKLFLIKGIEEGQPVSRACLKYGISRFTYYKWYQRYLKADEKEKLISLKSQRPVGVEHWRYIGEEIEKRILELVIQNPQYSTHKIAQIVSEVGNHGVQNVFKRLNLNTYEKRLDYVQNYQPVVKPLPVTAWTDRLKLVWDKFIPTRAPAGPPPSFISLFSRQPRKFAKIILLSTFLTTTLSSTFIYYIRMLSQAPTFSAKLGLIFASIALLTGSLFFIYSMKYYFTLAIVLSFSRHSNGNGEQIHPRGVPHAYGAGLFHLGGGNSNGNNNSILGWLGKVFGITVNGVSSPHSGFQTPGFEKSDGGVNENNSSLSQSKLAGGLQPNLDNIKLKRHPFVSIHIPLYNEKRVAERLLKACTSIKYPDLKSGQAQYEIIVCDDSTDETKDIVQNFADKWNKKAGNTSEGDPAKCGGSSDGEASENKPFIKILHRNTRQGYKGAALKNALKHMDKRTEFVVVFDADFVPYPDTLELFLKYFQANGLDLSKNLNNHHPSSIIHHPSNIAAVSGYQWHVLNKSENWITRGVRSEYAGSYVIERPGREILGLLKQISGSVYMIRADILKKIGWGTSITEDFELTLKLYEQGYKVVYTPYIQAPAECVSTLKRLIRQRMRWAEGHSNNIRKMFWRLLSGRWKTISGDISKGGKALISNYSNCSNYSNQALNPKRQKIGNWGIGNSLGQLEIRSIRNSNPNSNSKKKIWIPSPLTWAEKMEVLYLAPYYLQAAFY